MMGTRNGSQRTAVTLVEICVAIGILGFCMVPIISGSQANIVETQASQEDLLARHFLIDMVESYKGESMDKLRRLPTADVPVVQGEDEINIKTNQMLNEVDSQVDELRQKAAAGLGGTDSEGMKGAESYLNLRKTIKLSRVAVFHPGAPLNGAVVSELVCIVRWISTLNKQNVMKELKYSKVIVRPAI